MDLYHHRDFAHGFIGILGKSEAVGEIYHITSDEVLTWDQIAQLLAKAAGTEANIIHIPSDFIQHHNQELGEGLLGEKAYSMVFDNTKIKKINPDFRATISFAKGAEEIVDWYQGIASRAIVDLALDESMDMIISGYETVWKVKN